MKTTEEILAINKNQAEFYNTKKKNFATKIWSSIRGGALTKIRKEIGVQNQTYNLHKLWLGNLSDKKVLDLGCFSGNNLSIFIASNAKEYIGIDLSDSAIAKLNEKLEPYPNASAKAVDFLSNIDFPDKDFDIIYAYGVLHHFQNVNMLINRLNEKLTTNGIIIAYDPLETSLPIKIIRTLYRPFQSDKDWEWPFSKKTFYKFNTAFNIIERHGILGKSKWFFLFNFLPLSSDMKLSIAKKWHKQDWEISENNDSKLFSCMHLTMKMQKRT